MVQQGSRFEEGTRGPVGPRSLASASQGGAEGAASRCFAWTSRTEQSFLKASGRASPGDRGCGFRSSFCCPLQPHTLGLRGLAAPRHSRLWARSVDKVVTCVPAGLAGSPCCVWPCPEPWHPPACPLLPDLILRRFWPLCVRLSAEGWRGPRPTLPSGVDYIYTHIPRVGLAHRGQQLRPASQASPGQSSEMCLPTSRPPPPAGTIFFPVYSSWQGYCPLTASTPRRATYDLDLLRQPVSYVTALKERR